MTISTVDIKVTKSNNDLNERELKIMGTFLLNLSAQANAQVNGCCLALNPLEKLEGDIFNHKLSFEAPIEIQKFEELKEGISRRFNSALKMCDIKDVQITYIEDSFNIND